MSSRAFSRAAITRRLFNAPLAVMPDTAAIVLGAIGERLDVGQLFVASDGSSMTLPQLSELAADERAKIEARSRIDRVAPTRPAADLMMVYAGVAHIDIRGELVAENGIGPVSGFTGYDGICAQVASADADPDVRGLIYDIDCPGGEVASLFECVQQLMARRGTKPTRAIIRGVGCSAAYAIACCADEVTVHELGYAGSIGVIMMHVDFSQRLANDGIKVTLIAQGAHKADGNPFEPLPDEVKARYETLIATSYDRFVAHVADARGLDEKAVRAQQSRVFQGEEAVQAGLADKVMSWADSMSEFAEQVNGGGLNGRAARPAPGARTMKGSVMTTQTAAPADDTPVHTQAQMDAAVATAKADATTAERERISALAGLDSDSTISASLTKAISEGTSAGDYAIGLAQAAKAATATALEAAKTDAIKPDALPSGGAARGTGTGEKGNRGEAAVARFRGKIPGLPAKG